MKNTNQKLRFLILLMIFCSVISFAQDEETKGPKYIAVTTSHWNMDYENFDMDTWKAVEKEYYDKVTSKNELIMGSGVYMHRFTADNRELLSVSTYGSWEDIDKVNDRNSELVDEGWPDKEARDAYFQKRNAYYSDFHSDEIYATMPNAKPIDRTAAKIVLVRKGHLKFPTDGSQEEFMTTFKEYAENVFHKNEYIKGYFPSTHFWGSDRTEFIEAFFVDSMDDLDKMFDKNDELFNAHWADDEAKNKMQELSSKYFTGIHGDYIYTAIPELAK